MATTKDIYGSGEWLYATDLIDEGNDPIVVTIADIETGESGFDGRPQRQLSFNELDVKLSLNVTNHRSLTGFLGANDDKWVGSQIELFTIKTNNPSGQIVDAIRVRKPQGAPARATPASSGSAANGRAAPKIGTRAAKGIAVKLEEYGHDVAALAERLAEANITVEGNDMAKWPRAVIAKIAKIVESMEEEFASDLPF